MPKELIPSESSLQGPPEVYASLRDLIGMQHHAHGFSFLPRFAVQSILAGRHRSKLRGRGLDFDEVRKYVSGDDIRNIDWKVTARVGETHTKVFTEERERPVLLIIDQSPSMFFGSKRFLKSVIAAHTAALCAWRVLEVGDRIGGAVFDQEKMDVVLPRRDRSNVQQLLSMIANYNHRLSATSSALEKNMLNHTLSHAQQVVTHDYLVVVISDFHNVDDVTFKRLVQISRHNDIIGLQVRDPMEVKLPMSRMVITDGTNQTLMDSSNKLRVKFKEGSQQHQEWIYERFKKYNWPILTLSTDKAASTQLQRYIGGQMKKRRKS